MRLVTFRDADGPALPGAVLPAGSIVDLTSLPAEGSLHVGSVAELLSLDVDTWKRLAERVERVATDPSEGLDRRWVHDAGKVQILPPTGTKPFFFSCGGIFLSHRREMNLAGDPPRRPDGYVVNPNILIGTGQAVVLPEEAPTQVDWEGELCLVFGRPAHGVDASDALDHIAGYTIYNDISARDHVPMLLSDDPREAVAGYAANVLYKGFPTFGPLGPAIVTRDELPDIASARLRTTVNGQVMQDDAVGNLGRTIPEVVAALTEVHTFGVGDILSLGTPAGVGYARSPRTFLVPGDTVEVSVDGIGALTNPVVAADGRH